jgi:hypothetical protein|tara:strand:- start:229 stop:558 length:330 start_codon:yes stop_codon:yes gene_type:complete
MNGEVLNGREQISKHHLLCKTLKLVSTKSDVLILANHKKSIDYEVIENYYDIRERHKKLIIWQTANSKRIRVFEFIGKVDSAGATLVDVDERRKLWLELWNQHEAKELI